MQDGVYAAAGKMIAYFIVHRGPVPTFFSRFSFDMLVMGCDGIHAKKEDIMDYDIQAHLEKVNHKF